MNRIGNRTECDQSYPRIRILSTAVIVLMTSFPFHDAYSVDLSDMPSASEWHDVDVSQMVAVFDLLADHMKGNFETIRTWEGEYDLEVEDSCRPEQLPQEALRDLGVARKGLVQRVESTIHFVLDMESEATYWERKDPKLTWLRPNSRETVLISNARVEAERSFCAGGKYFHFAPTNVVPELADLRGNPAAQNKRVAYKDPVEYVKKQQTRDLLDPRLFWGPDVSTTYWDYIAQLKERAGKLGSALKVLQAEGNGGPWYRISLSLRGGGLAVMTCSPEAHFNPVRRVLSLDDAGEKVLKDVQWEWKRFGEVYLPAEVEIVEFDRASVAPRGLLKATLGMCLLNKPLEPQQFTYEALGLKEGDLVMDRVDKQFLMYEKGELVKLADFGETYVPAGSRSSTAMSITRWVLVAFSIVFLAILLTILAITKVRSRRG